MIAAARTVEHCGDTVHTTEDGITRECAVSAVDVLTAALHEQGAAFPHAGALLLMTALKDAGYVLVNSSPRTLHHDRNARLVPRTVTRDEIRAGDSNDIVGVVTTDTLRDSGDVPAEQVGGVWTNRDFQAAVVNVMNRLGVIEWHLTGHASPSLGNTRSVGVGSASGNPLPGPDAGQPGGAS